MDITVRDERGQEIKVGTRAVYGCPEPENRENAIVTVTEISEPDVYYNPVTDADDGGYGVKITVRFPTGETDTLDAMAVPAQWYGDETNVFEEGGDLEVIETEHTHTHTIKDGKTVCVYCGQELEL